MSEESRKFDDWESVIIDFFENKVPKSKLYKARDYIAKKDKKIKLENEKNKREKLIKEKEEKQNELKYLRDEAPSTEIRQWIDKISQIKLAEGKRIIKATHVLKFSHSSSLSDGFMLEERSNDVILTTSSLKRMITYDLAHNNGSLVSVSRFLALKLSEKLIIDLILNGDYSFFKPFYKNQEQLKRWSGGFEKLVEEREIKTADKAKQIYYPLIKDNEQISINHLNYHLMIPLFSSSLAEKIFTIVSNHKFGGEQENIRKQMKASNELPPKYHPKTYIGFPRLGVQKFGGKNPQNVSMLNKNRSGKSYLFISQPPTWENQLKPPIYKGSLFDNFGSSHINEDINYLRDFLFRFERIGLSIKEPKRYAHLVRWINSIIDEVLFYTASIQQLPSNWSATDGIKLKPEHQYFLDPYRNENDFQSKRQSIGWQTVVCNDFARWLDNKLKGQDKKFTPQPEYTRLWKQLFEEPLREDAEVIKAGIKIKQQEEQV